MYVLRNKKTQKTIVLTIALPRKRALLAQFVVKNELCFSDGIQNLSGMVTLHARHHLIIIIVFINFKYKIY